MLYSQSFGHEMCQNLPPITTLCTKSNDLWQLTLFCDIFLANLILDNEVFLGLWRDFFPPPQNFLRASYSEELFFPYLKLIPGLHPGNLNFVKEAQHEKFAGCFGPFCKSAIVQLQPPAAVLLFDAKISPLNLTFLRPYLIFFSCKATKKFRLNQTLIRVIQTWQITFEFSIWV